MNPKLLRRLLVGVVAVGVFAGIYYYTHAPLLRIRLKDGTEIRVLKVAYGTGANHEHELTRPSELKRRLLQSFPQRWQEYFNPPTWVALLPPNAINAVLVKRAPFEIVASEPFLSVWWLYDLPQTPGDPAQPTPKGHFIIRMRGTDFHKSRVTPGEADILTFPMPAEPDATFPIHFVLNGQPVDFTVSVPPCAEPGHPDPRASK